MGGVVGDALKGLRRLLIYILDARWAANQYGFELSYVGTAETVPFQPFQRRIFFQELITIH